MSDTVTVIQDTISEAYASVYEQPWWLGIASRSGAYGEARVVHGNAVVGRLPYVNKRNYVGLRMLGLAPWTRLNGPILSQQLNDDEKRDVLHELLSQVPRRITASFACGPHSPDAEIIRQVFIAAGYVHTRKHTYSETPEDDDFLARLKAKHRTHVNTAAKRLDLPDISADGFVHFYEANLRVDRRKSHSPLDVMRDLIAKGQEGENPHVRVFAARQKAKSDAGVEPPLDAAIACAWDNRRYYLWLTTRRRHVEGSPHEKPNSDAIKVLILQATRHAKQLGLIFDADGVGVSGADKLYSEVLKFPNTEVRDVYRRPTTVGKIFFAWEPRLKKLSRGLGIY